MRLIFIIIACLCLLPPSRAQEAVAPLDHNRLLHPTPATAPAFKTTALSLPFFEDFTGMDVYPDPDKWTDRYVYINNTMGYRPVSRGVATFDALNALGGPYDSISNSTLRFADSLTSQIIDLSTYTPADSLYLSFFYQPQGNGFAPEAPDSFFLFFKRQNGSWARMWYSEGKPLQEFRQVMVPVTNSQFFHTDFQFRFVNKASMNINDDVWNLDFIRLDANRNAFDTLVADLATSTEPSFLLNDFTFMPWRQFAADMQGNLNNQHYYYLRNNHNTPQNFQWGYSAREATTNTPLFSGPLNGNTINAWEELQLSAPMYSFSFNPADPYDKVILEQTYFAIPSTPENSGNDTIVKQQVFDNYLAYDDGTAEKSWFLNQFATLPARMAIEYRLQVADTLRGVAIYFGRQVPLASNKFFSVTVYGDIAYNGGTDQVLYQQDLLFPSYADTINHFWFYRFDTPVLLNAGTFYIGTVQPAASGSDSLYFGLDVNRIGGNHLYFDVNGYWEPSIISGAVMVRPVLGKYVAGTRTETLEPVTGDWSIHPNPAGDRVRVITGDRSNSRYELEIHDLQGRLVRTIAAETGDLIDIQDLQPGLYLVRGRSASSILQPQKLLKL